MSLLENVSLYAQYCRRKEIQFTVRMRLAKKQKLLAPDQISKIFCDSDSDEYRALDP